MRLESGDTALISEQGVLRWVRVILAAPARTDGTQQVTVKELDTPSAKPRRVVMGQNSRVVQLS